MNFVMVNTLFDGKNRTGTGISILEPIRETLTQDPNGSANVSDQSAILRPQDIQNRINVFRRIHASHTAKRLSIVFDVLATIILAVLLGDEEDDLRLHPAFIRSMESWRRQ